MKYKCSYLANRDVADYPSLLVQISRMRIDDIEFGRLWIRLCSVKIPGSNKSPSGTITENMFK